MAVTVCNFHIKYDRNSDLTSSTVNFLIKKFKETESINDLKYSGFQQVVQHETLKQFWEYYDDINSAPWIGQFKNWTLREVFYNIFSQKICIFIHKIQLTQELKPTNHAHQ